MPAASVAMRLVEILGRFSYPVYGDRIFWCERGTAIYKFPHINARLKRANGHLQGVIEMLEQASESMPREIRELLKEFQGVTKYF